MDCETVLFAFIEFDGSVFTMMLRLFELKLQLLVSVINEDEELLTVIEYIIQDIIGCSLSCHSHIPFIRLTYVSSSNCLYSK